MYTKSQLSQVERKINEILISYYDTKIDKATDVELYYALSKLAVDFMHEKKAKDKLPKPLKTVHYISIEFLIGKSLKNNLWNLELVEPVTNYLAKHGKNIESVYAIESDAGLGNGGLGRLAACYLESLAKCNYRAMGHSIKYEYGLFKQKIIDGKQEQFPDEWLSTGRVWLQERDDQIVEVEIGGKVIEHYSDQTGLSYELAGTTKIEAVPFDMMISAYGTSNTSTIRLWEARAKQGINLHLFDVGEFESSLAEATKVSEINKVLYPNDSNEKGKDLRLIQEYFLASAVMQNILNNYFKNNQGLENLPEQIAVHINDTHPALCIPEFMRLLVDKYHYGWELSFEALKKVISYTNHTILAEALEVKRLYAIEKYMPRIAMILRELDRRFRLELSEFNKNDYSKIDSLAIISGNNVYMANLAIYASRFINGVATIHSNILKSKLFADYYKMYPERFTSVTNGISHRRWLCEANPKLNGLIVSLIGNGFYDNAEELKRLLDFENNEMILNKLEEIKFENKKRLSDFVQKNLGIIIDPSSRFDVQIKRIHEYKRQLMNVMKIIYLMNEIRSNPSAEITKQVFIFAGKAASGYQMARRIIELIVCVSKEIEADERLKEKLQVVFLENYNVSLAEILMPATEVSEQISLAGREASGTGNMKAVINGALMLCTIDGANIEICEKCDRENMFEFGLTADEVEKIKSTGYNAMDYMSSSSVRSVLDSLTQGIGGEKFEDIVHYLLGTSGNRDVYMCLADFDSYISTYYKLDKVYKNKREWNRRCLHAIASMGYFSSDRAILEYAKNIWKIDKVN